MMSLGMLGWGPLTAALAEGWLRAGHPLQLAVQEEPDPSFSDWRTLHPQVPQQEPAALIEGQEVLILSAPWSDVAKLLRCTTDWSGKLLVDATLPLLNEHTLEVGHSLSGAEIVQEFAPGSTVIKAFQGLSAHTVAHPNYGDFVAETYLCGDHSHGKAVVQELARELGLASLDCGSLQRARLLEPLALLRQELAQSPDLDDTLVFRLLRRTPP